MGAVDQLHPHVGIVRACYALGVARSSYWRYRNPSLGPPAPRRPRRSHRRLRDEERREVVALAHSPRFVDVAPAAIVATLLDEDSRYLCAVRTMYRILAEEGATQDRRNQRRHPHRPAPELVACAPNRVWSWDITRLPTQRRCSALFLYLILDLYSRFAVGWMVADQETGQLARRLVQVTAERQGIRPGTLQFHSDRGAPMIAKTLKDLLDDLDIQRSFSRPRTSDDNPYVESLFKTVKYHPAWPGSFGSQAEAEAWATQFFRAYNGQHRHSSLHGLTPATVHAGEAGPALEARHAVLMAAYEAHPERFVAGPPKLQELPAQVWINDPTKRPAASGAFLISTNDVVQSC